MDNPTQDLSKFGNRERKIAAELLLALNEQGIDCLGDGIALNFNTQSGFVFLSDEDFNVAMMNGDKLEQFYSCPECGSEGFADEIRNHSDQKKECKEYLKEIGVEKK